MSVLVLFAHPALEKSRINRQLLAAIRGLDGVSLRDLYELYPELDIDVPAEQEALLAAEVVVFHHPLYWYSSPAILKEWMDLVLQHGWAYGSRGTALRGKTLLSVVTTGGASDAYAQGGFNGFTLREFLRPFEQTARLCGMRYLAPFALHGTHQMVEEEVTPHADSYRTLLEALRDGRLNLDRAAAAERLDGVQLRELLRREDA